jgi:hypothetical protein
MKTEQAWNRLYSAGAYGDNERRKIDKFVCGVAFSPF